MINPLLIGTNIAKLIFRDKGKVHKILIVDDDKLIRWSLKEMFTQEGYEVDAVASTKDALSQATNKPYNLIFADVELSKEMGFDMLREINKLQPLAKIVILSAYTKHQIEPFLGTLNIFSIVEKPFQSEKIKALAKEALDTLKSTKKGGGNHTG